MEKELNSGLFLVPFTKEFLDYSYNWLQDEEIRTLIGAKQITRKEQLFWFNSLKHRNNYLIWGVEYLGFPIGVCEIKNIVDEEGEYWGYIGLKKFWGKGLGGVMIELAEEKALENSLRKLCLFVNIDNLRAINLYKKMNFITLNTSDRVIKMRKVL